MPGEPEALKSVLIVRSLEGSTNLLCLAFLFLMIFGSFTAAPLAAASDEPKVIISEATYTMGDGETPYSAEARVLQRAKQVALQVAGTYLENHKKEKSLELTSEEIQTIAGSLVDVEVLEQSRNLVADGLLFYTKIKAMVTTDKMEEVAHRIRGSNAAAEYKKLQQEYARLAQDLETWKKLVVRAPRGSEKEELAHEKIRKLEEAFARIQRNEAALFERVID